MKLVLACERETAALRTLPIDKALVAAAAERVVDQRAPLPDREEAVLLALLLRGHLSSLVAEMTEVLENLQDEGLRAQCRRALAEAELLLAMPPIYTARGTVAVVPFAFCCRDLHRHLAAAAHVHSTP